MRRRRTRKQFLPCIDDASFWPCWPIIVRVVKDVYKRQVWDEEFMAGSNNTVMVHIRHLREKLGDDAQNPRFIKNIWGVGYTIEK